MNRNKAQGTSAETAVVNWLREHGYPYARRLTMKGSRDEGDVSLGDGINVAIEVKYERRIDLAGYMKELEAEVANSESATGAVIVKKRGTTNVGDWYAVMPVSYLAELLAEAGYTTTRRPIRLKRSR